MFSIYVQEIDESVATKGRPKGSSAVMSSRRKIKYENAVTGDQVLSEMNEVEHLLNQGYTREMIDIVLFDQNNEVLDQNNEVSTTANFDALTMLADVAV